MGSESPRRFSEEVCGQTGVKCAIVSVVPVKSVTESYPQIFTMKKLVCHLTSKTKIKNEIIRRK